MAVGGGAVCAELPAAEPPDAVLARYYDLEHDPLTADVALYRELARRVRGPVLELGCGTGRVLAALVRDGRRAVGVDRAAAMLARAERRLRQTGAPPDRWQLVAGDVRALALAERFALVLAPLDFLGYFATREEQLAVLGVARTHLRPRGQLVLDVAFPPTAIVGQPEGLLVHQWTRPEPDGSLVTKWWVREIDPVAQVQQLTAYYDTVAPDGTLRRWVEPLRLRYYYPPELELLLLQAGFAIVALYGGYDLAPLTAESARVIVLARVVTRRGASLGARVR